MITFSFFIIPVNHCLHFQFLTLFFWQNREISCCGSLLHPNTTLQQTLPCSDLQAHDLRLVSVWVWCLITKRGTSRERVREEGWEWERVREWSRGGGSEGSKAQETTALNSLPEESQFKGTGDTQSSCLAKKWFRWISRTKQRLLDSAWLDSSDCSLTKVQSKDLLTYFRFLITTMFFFCNCCHVSSIFRVTTVSQG